MNGPLSPEELAQMQSYYGGTPGVNMSDASAPLPPPAPAMSVQPIASTPDPVASYYGAPPPVPPSPPPAPQAPAASTVDPGVMSALKLGANLSSPATPAATGLPTKTTPQEDAAFEAYKQGLSVNPKAAPKPATGSAGGFGKLQKNVADDQQRLMSTYDAEKGAAQREGVVRSGHAAMLADRQQEIARLQDEDAAIAHAEEADAQQRFDSHLAEAKQQLEDVRAEKIDPLAWKKGNDAMPFVVVLGSLLGGLYQGINKMEKNPFIEDLNQEIDRSIKVQKDNIASKRDSALDNLNLLGQQRAIYKDHQLAELQLRNLKYEAAKTQLASDAAKTDSQLAKTEADKGISLIDREQQKVQKAFDDHALQSAQAQAAAAAAQARAARKEAIETQLKLIELGIKSKEVDAKAGKESADQSQKLGEALSKPELIEAKQTISDIKNKMMKTGPDGKQEWDLERGVPGVGQGANVRSSWLFNPVVPIGGAKNNPPLGLDQEEKIGRQEWERLAIAYRHAVTGAGGSDKEAEGIMAAFSGANSPAEQANAVRLADEALARRESRIKAGFDSNVVKNYEGRESEEHTRATSTVPRERVK